jgi:hypothetical protein
LLPDSIEALVFLGNAAQARGDGDTAVNLLSRASKADPANVDILMHLGALYRAAERFDFVEGADQFQLHFDSLDYTSSRYLVFLWYLNDVSEGGETDFPDLGLRVDARAGRLLVFPPYWMFQHAGPPPKSNEKYIISTYLLF